MSITFKKKVSSSAAAPSAPAPPRLPSGTRLNPTGTLLLTSTGIPSLDTFIGGGIAIGSLLIIYEDPTGNLSDSIVRCFLSEGVYNKQDLCVVAMRNDPSENLPVKEEPLDNEKASEDNEQSAEKMKIAWRYENLSAIETVSHLHYDLQSTKRIPSEYFDQIRLHRFTWNDYERSQSTGSFRCYLLQQIRQLITEQYSSQQSEKRILRLALPSFSSLLCDSDPSTHSHSDELFTFLYHLRVLLRTSLCTCVLTMNERSKSLENLADFVIDLKLSTIHSNDYVGFCQLIKLPRLNTMQGFVPETWDIAMKLIKHRKNLLFEKYSIPPDLSEEASREEKSKTTMSCSSSKEFDF